MKNNKLFFSILAMPGAIFLIIFLVLPLMSIVVFSFWETKSYTLIVNWNINNYITLLSESTYLTFLFRSLVIATIVSFISLVFAWPVAFFIARYGGQYKIILLLLTSAPFLTGEILRVTAMQQILGPIGLINMGLASFGIEPIQAIMYTNIATSIGLVYLWLPFMILAIYLSLLNFEFELLEVAKVNGAKPLRAFWEVTWPLNKAGSSIGIVLVFIPTLASSITSKFLGGPNGALFGNILSHQFGSTGTWALGSAMGVLLFIISTLVLYLVWKFMGGLEKSGIIIKGGDA